MRITGGPTAFVYTQAHYDAGLPFFISSGMDLSGFFLGQAMVLTVLGSGETRMMMKQRKMEVWDRDFAGPDDPLLPKYGNVKALLPWEALVEAGDCEPTVWSECVGIVSYSLAEDFDAQQFAHWTESVRVRLRIETDADGIFVDEAGIRGGTNPS